jgi:uncharacterized protein (DUF2062 family)
VTTEEQKLRALRSERIRRVKRWLRPLPRRTNIHRYPVLNRFAASARKRIHLWSFRVENVVPALYAGCILTLLPLYGIQIPIAFVLALLLRANLPILVGLQVVSNPFTVLPIWYSAYQVGRHVLSLAAIETAPLKREQVQTLLDNFAAGNWGRNVEQLFSVFAVTSLGSIVIGAFFGLVCSVTYRILARRTAAIVEKLQEHQQRGRERRAGGGGQGTGDRGQGTGGRRQGAGDPPAPKATARQAGDKRRQAKTEN